MNAHNREVIGRLLGDLDRFARGEIGLDSVQAALQAAPGILERDGTSAQEAIRLAEADVEEIRFSKLLDEQRPAAVFRLDELRDQLAEEFGDG
jgi:hypothetical protein